MKYLFFFIMVCFFNTKLSAQEPPSSFDIMKWYWNGFPKKHNGWNVSVQEVIYIYGYTEGVKTSIVNVVCDTCGYLPKYSFDVKLSYGYENGTILSVLQNKDTANKYFSIYHK